MAYPLIDPIKLTQDLIGCPSVTPKDEGALDCLQTALDSLGFMTKRLCFEDDATAHVDNLYARLGSGVRRFCFAGHTDVVPETPAQDWRFPPFEALIENGLLYGRGASDMKGAIGAFVAGVSQFLQNKKQGFEGAICLLITGDEEGIGINGMRKMLPALKQQGEYWDHCITGEPTNPHHLGEMMKVGRRGSLNVVLNVKGKAGHVGYPALADNAAHSLLQLLTSLTSWSLDKGTAYFDASTLAVSRITIDNQATNVIPGEAQAVFNIRFNDTYTSASLIKILEQRLRCAAKRQGLKDIQFTLDIQISGESFVTPKGRLSDLVTMACQDVVGITPEASTSGGTSDSRFIKDYCPVIDFGGVGKTMHQVDEHQAVMDIENLGKIYSHILDNYFV